MTITRTRTTTTFIAGALATAAMTPATANTASLNQSACDSLQHHIHHVVNPESGAVLITPWHGEADSAASKYGYNDQRPGFTAGNRELPGLVPVTRYYNPTSHTFAYSQSALAGHDAQRTKFYVAPTPQSCTVPVYEYTKNGKRSYAWTATHDDAMRNDGWHRGPAVFHVKATGGHQPIASDGQPDPEPNPGTEPKPGEDNKPFTFAIIPDTQREVTDGRDKRIVNRADYLIQSRQWRNTAAAIQVGDMMNWDTPNHEQYERANKALTKLDKAGLRWIATIGNHDTAATCPGGSACPNTDVRKTIRDTKTYNRYFGTHRFPNLGGTWEPKKIDNAYRTFTAGGLKWLAINLEIYPRQGAVDWAKEVTRKHPNHNVIVITHSYLGSDGTVQNTNDDYGALTPQQVHDQLVMPHSNIKLVIGGHRSPVKHLVETRPDGTKVAQYLVGVYEDDRNPMAFMSIDPSNGNIYTEVYSPRGDVKYPQYTSWVGAVPFNR